MKKYSQLSFLKICLLLFFFLYSGLSVAEINIDAADVFFSEGEFKQALKHYHKALRDNPNSVQALLGIASCNLKFGHNEMAQGKITKVLNINGNNTKALYLQGKLQLQKQQYESAKTTLQKLISIDPDYLEAYTILSSALYSLGDIKGSDKVYETLKTKQAAN